MLLDRPQLDHDEQGGVLVDRLDGGELHEHGGVLVDRLDDGELHEHLQQGVSLLVVGKKGLVLYPYSPSGILELTYL